MWQDILGKLTHLGDPVLLLLCGLGVFFYLWSDDERRVLARSWAMALGFCISLTVAGKLVFHLIRWNEENFLRLLSPSGHVAIGTGFYGGCAIMLASQHGRGVRVLICIVTALLLGMLAASRLVLELHSVPEIVVAFAIGGASLGVFTTYPGHRWPVRISPGQLISLILLIWAAYFTPRISGEALILQIVEGLRQMWHWDGRTLQQSLSLPSRVLASMIARGGSA